MDQRNDRRDCILGESWLIQKLFIDCPLLRDVIYLAISQDVYESTARLTVFSIGQMSLNIRVHFVSLHK